MPIRFEDGISQFHKQVILQRAPNETVGAIFDNAVNTRFVYDAIMHIFACNND